jgi:hypothetical protein
MKRVLFAVLLLALAAPAHAAIIGVGTGTGAPPATLGGYSIAQWTPPGIYGYTPVLSAGTGPGGLTAAFSGTMQGICIQCGDWASWSHGFQGQGYYSGGATSVSMTLSAPVSAFLFYAEPNPFSVFRMTATAQDGTSLTLDVDGAAGAKGFGFYGTGGSMITGITFDGGGADFALAEFGSNTGTIPGVPDPGSSLLLLGLGLAGLAWRKRA